MKKLISIFGIFTMIICLSCCGINNSDKVEKTTEAECSSEKAEPEESTDILPEEGGPDSKSDETEATAETDGAELPIETDDSAKATEAGQKLSGIYQFAGNWQNTYSERCSMVITCPDDNNAHIEISWASSAFEVSYWVFDAVYDEAQDTLLYQNGSCYEQYVNDDGSKDETLVYSDGTGRLYFNENGEIYWQDDIENAGVDAPFAKE